MKKDGKLSKIIYQKVTVHMHGLVIIIMNGLGVITKLELITLDELRVSEG
jgi:hypothetical protein